MTPELGIGFQSDKHPDDYTRLAAAAEGYGFDVLSVYSDLMYQPPIFPLLTMAAATERVRLGPACLNPYSLAPFEIAGQAAALDLASGGRAYLGIARGAWLGDVGLDQPKPVTAVREAISVVRHLLSGATEGFTGTRFRLAPGITLRYEPLRPSLPIMIGTWGVRTAALAGELADELKVGGSANPDMVGVMRERIRAGTDRVGRDVDDVRIVMGAVTVVDHDGAAARERARQEVAMYLSVVAELDTTLEIPAPLIAEVRGLVAASEHELAGRVIPDHVLDCFALAGTPGEVADRVSALVDAGAGRVEFGTPHGLTEAQGVKLLGTEVLPRLHAGG